MGGGKRGQAMADVKREREKGRGGGRERGSEREGGRKRESRC